MIFPNSVLYATILCISAGISALMAYFVWNRRKRSSVTLPLVALMASMTAWALPYACFWLAPDSASRQFWIDASYPGVVGVPASFFAFILAYTHRERWLTRRNVLLLCIEPVLCCLLLWTDSAHHLFTAGLRSPDATAIKGGGIGYWGNFVYSYGMLAITFGILIHFCFTVQRAYRRQALTILLAALIPMVANLISIFQDVQHGLDPTAPAFTISGLIFIYSLFYQKLLDLAPVARGRVIEMMRDSMIAVDERGRIVDVNPAAQRLLDAGGKDNVIGRPISEFLSRWSSHINSEASTRSSLEVEIEQDGTLKTYAISTSPLRDDQGKTQGQVLILRDITEHKRSEEALRQSLEYRQAVFDSVNDSIFIYDADVGKIVDVNERLLELHGYTREEIVGAPTIELLSSGVPPYDAEHAGKKLLLARTEGAQTFEWLAKHKTKGTFWMEVRVRREMIGGNERFIISSNDITMRKLAQERALELDKERDRIGLLKRFITDASHDFRTPLSTIGTSAYLLSKELPPERRERHSTTIQEQVQHIIKLLDNFLEVAHLDVESEPLAVHPLDANEIVRAVIEPYRADENEQRIAFALQTDLPLVAADPQALEQVVRQLVANAVNFTPAPGTIQVSTYTEGDQAVIEVSDNGIGISAIDLPRIFDTFFRADAARSATTGGAGLGLSITKRLVEGMHGSIEVKSKLREGSCFRIRLPLAREKVMLPEGK
jgi:PAS domain S-box-containing protein